MFSSVYISCWHLSNILFCTFLLAYSFVGCKGCVNFLPLAGLNKNLKKLLGEHAEFQALTLKDTVMASDGTKKVVSLSL